MAILTSILFVATFMQSMERRTDPFAGREHLRPVYLLYSWQSTAREWQFSILSGSVSRSRTPEEVFDSKTAMTGLDALERQLIDLEDGADIVWVDAVPTLKRDPVTGQVTNGPPVPGMERLSLPAEGIIDKVRVLTAKHHLRLEVEMRGGR